MIDDIVRGSLLNIVYRMISPYLYNIEISMILPHYTLWILSTSSNRSTDNTYDRVSYSMYCTRTYYGTSVVKLYLNFRVEGLFATYNTTTTKMNDGGYFFSLTGLND